PRPAAARWAWGTAGYRWRESVRRGDGGGDLRAARALAGDLAAVTARGDERLDLLGDALVAVRQLLDVEVLEPQHAHVLVGALHLRPPQADVLDGGDDAAEQRLAELGHHLVAVDVGD